MKSDLSLRTVMLSSRVTADMNLCQLRPATMLMFARLSGRTRALGNAKLEHY